MLLWRSRAQKIRSHALTEADVKTVVEQTEGYSGSDLRCLVQQASRGQVKHFNVLLTESCSREDTDRVLPGPLYLPLLMGPVGRCTHQRPLSLKLVASYL